MKKGFTLIELVVAVALLSMVLSFAGVIFNVSIESHRTAKANAEIMRNLRAITDQLNTDFAGIQTDAPLLIWFERQEPNDPNRYDQIMFFANGDFQSIQLYNDREPDWEDGYRTISGNVARIHYGQAQIGTAGNSEDPEDMDEQDRMLARRQHILTADEGAENWPAESMSNFDFDRNEWYEHDSLSLAEWKTVEANEYDTIVEVCFDERPWIDMDDPQITFHKLMCEGVGSFAIQWAYWDDSEERFLWFPSEDPAGDGSKSPHFRWMGDKFGVLFNVPGTSFIFRWEFIEDGDVKYDTAETFESSFYPKALKFTFRLYDSKGIINEDGERGREFTHIVYLGG
ncbi:MAG: type II secretion system protein [Planctomycetota bacterium]|nr:MAG: type II secretion system protein [Planctomycetota bacterium]